MAITWANFENGILPKLESVNNSLRNNRNTTYTNLNNYKLKKSVNPNEGYYYFSDSFSKNTLNKVYTNSTYYMKLGSNLVPLPEYTSKKSTATSRLNYLKLQHDQAEKAYSTSKAQYNKAKARYEAAKAKEDAYAKAIKDKEAANKAYITKVEQMNRSSRNFSFKGIDIKVSTISVFGKGSLPSTNRTDIFNVKNDNVSISEIITPASEYCPRYCKVKIHYTLGGNTNSFSGWILNGAIGLPDYVGPILKTGSTSTTASTSTVAAEVDSIKATNSTSTSSSGNSSPSGASTSDNRAQSNNTAVGSCKVGTYKIPSSRAEMNIRTKPDTDSALAGTLPGGSSVDVKGCSGNWGKISVNGKEAWIYTPYLEFQAGIDAAVLDNIIYTDPIVHNGYAAGTIPDDDLWISSIENYTQELDIFDLPEYDKAKLIVHENVENIWKQRTFEFILGISQMNFRQGNIVNHVRTGTGYLMLRNGAELAQLSVAGSLLDSGKADERRVFLENFYKKFLTDKVNAFHEYFNDTRVMLEVEGMRYYGVITSFDLSRNSNSLFLFQYQFQMIVTNSEPLSAVSTPTGDIQQGEETTQEVTYASKEVAPPNLLAGPSIIINPAYTGVATSITSKSTNTNYS